MNIPSVIPTIYSQFVPKYPRMKSSQNIPVSINIVSAPCVNLHRNADRGNQLPIMEN